MTAYTIRRIDHESALIMDGDRQVAVCDMADAALLASAPALLESAREIVTYCNGTNPQTEYDLYLLFHKARRAVLQATAVPS